MGLAAACPIGAPSTSHTDVVVSVGFSPGRILVAGASPGHSQESPASRRIFICSAS